MKYGGTSDSKNKEKKRILNPYKKAYNQKKQKGKK